MGDDPRSRHRLGSCRVRAAGYARVRQAAADSPRFLLLKPSVVYTVVGAAMLPRGWVARYVPAIAVALLPARALDRAGWGWAALMFATALVNLALVARLPPSMAAALFLAWGMTSKLALFLAQYHVLRAVAVRNHAARSTA